MTDNEETYVHIPDEAAAALPGASILPDGRGTTGKLAFPFASTARTAKITLSFEIGRVTAVLPAGAFIACCQYG